MRQTLLRAACLTLIFGGGAAWACGNSIRHERLLPMSVADQEKLQQAQEHFASGDCDQALPLATALLDGSLAPDRNAFKIAGICELKGGRFEAAREHLIVAANKFKSQPYIVAKLGEAEVALAKFDHALPRLEMLNKKSLLPDADSHVALARARAHKGNKAGALEALAAALALTADHPGALAAKAEVEAMPESVKVRPTPKSKPLQNAPAEPAAPEKSPEKKS